MRHGNFPPQNVQYIEKRKISPLRIAIDRWRASGFTRSLADSAGSAGDGEWKEPP